MAENTDTYFDTEKEARKEVVNRKTLCDEMTLVRYERTGYGNWRVYSVPADMMVNMIADGPSVDLDFLRASHKKSSWVKS